MPYRPTERQYRNFAASNFQPVVRETQLDEDGNEVAQEPSYVVRGHFTTFGAEYELMPGFFESIDPHALDEADMSDVIYQENHEGAPMARIRNGSLRVGIDPDGGWCEADLGGSQRGRDHFEAVQSGLIVEMSFGFTIEDDGFEWEEDEDGNIHSRITRISKVFDVSGVSIPANPGTEISARAYLDGAIEAKQKQQEMLQRAEQERAEALSRRRRAAMALKLAQIR